MVFTPAVVPVTWTDRMHSPFGRRVPPEKLMVPVSLKVDTKAQFLANAKDAVAKAKSDD